MNENSLWACFWFACALGIIGISASTAYIQTTEFTVAANNGLKQQLVGNRVIWIKVPEGNK